MKKEDMNDLIKNTKEFNILYVEDDKEARISTLKFFKSFFLNVDTALNGEDAWLKFQNNKYDIVITDINMPEMCGIELISKIREYNPTLPILVLSAYNNTEYFLESIKYGIDGYLLKPIDLEPFFFTISKITRKIELEKSILDYQNKLELKVEAKTKKLEHRCFHEFYTDLPNSIMLQEDLLKNQYSHMLLLDMSNFSVINKEYGKVFSNNAITNTARALENHIHKKAKLYKVESDRFIILVKDSNSQNIHDYCSQIISFFDSKNIKVDNVELHITFNIGVAAVTDNTAETLINTEYALDKSKLVGSRNYKLYDENITSFKGEKNAIKYLGLTRRLVLEDKIEPYFQPIKNIAKNKIEKYEVLARGIINDEIILPINFIDPAEKLGFITSITRMMINKSFLFFKDNKYSFSINITERDLLENYLIKFLKEKTSLYNINPSRVTFEILENVTISKNSDQITKQLNTLRDLGFKIAIDDFGMENSNFGRLLEINIDFIKLDGILTRNLNNNKKTRTITKAIVNLAKTLNIKTIAEFVENKEIYDIVTECGVDFVQGYYIGKPEDSLIKEG